MLLGARALLFIAPLGLLALAMAGVACGTDAVGVESCQKVERVRCESAQACNIDLTRPYHSGDTQEKNVGACIRYYDDQCLHGLVTPNDPGPQAVDSCVNAIITGSCDVVRTPESHPDCKWLVPPPEPAAPPPPAPVADAGAD
jgi:hypothetical protein